MFKGNIVIGIVWKISFACKYKGLKMLRSRSVVYSHDPTEMGFQKRLAVSIFPFPVLTSVSKVQQKRGVVALPYTLLL